MKLLDLLTERKFIEFQSELKKLNDVDLAELLEKFKDKDLAIAFRLLPKDRAAEVFSYLPFEKQEYLIIAFKEGEIINILKSISLDDIVYLLEEAPSNVVKKVLEHSTKEKRSMINQLLSYEEDSAGSIMTVEFAVFKPNYTVKEALEKLREIGDVETINSCYIKSEDNHLLGVINLRKLIISHENTIIEDIMEKNPISVETKDDQEFVAKLFKKYDLNAMPVVDSEKRLVGIITVDDIIDVIDQEATEDFEKMAGMEPLEKPYMKTGVLSLTKHRVIWLLVLMISATLTGGVISKYENVLESSVLLAAFIPMLMDTGGNAGSQSSSLIIRNLALGTITIKDWLKVFFKELRVGVLTGIILAIVNFFRLVYFVKVDLNIAIAVCTTLIATVTVSKTIGSLLPMFAKLVKQDPAIMAAPLITTIVDTVSLVIYFSIATKLLNL
jgi:magnesium transporter